MLVSTVYYDAHGAEQLLEARTVSLHKQPGSNPYCVKDAARDLGLHARVPGCRVDIFADVEVERITHLPLPPTALPSVITPIVTPGGPEPQLSLWRVMQRPHGDTVAVQEDVPLDIISTHLTCRVVDLQRSTGSHFNLLVRTLAGKDVHLTGCTPFMLISDLKQMVQDAEGTPAHRQRLIINGQQLEDGKPCAAYNITCASSNPTIFMVLRICGSTPTAPPQPPSFLGFRSFMAPPVEQWCTLAITPLADSKAVPFRVQLPLVL